MKTDPTIPLRNRILVSLSECERATLLADAQYTVIPANQILPTGDKSTVFFPDGGAFCWFGDMTTGHQVAVAIVGTDGLVGISTILGMTSHTLRLVSLFEAPGYRIPTATFTRAFDQSQQFRAGVLAYIGRQLLEVSSLVACNRLHSHRQRLSRWLLMMADKSNASSLKITHDVLAQVVGGPRHAVTVGLNKLRADGAIAHLRGRIDILDRARLRANACECYVDPASDAGV